MKVTLKLSSFKFFGLIQAIIKSRPVIIKGTKEATNQTNFDIILRQGAQGSLNLQFALS